MDTTAVGTMIGTMVDNVESVLTTNIPLVLVITASLIGLTFIIRFARKHAK